MNKAIGAGAAVIGAILLYYGIQAKQSVASQVSELFTGSPTDNSMLLMVSGGGLLAVGLFLLLRKV